MFETSTVDSSAAYTAASVGGRVVIVGGGIHGVTLAYYLTRRGVKPLVIERTSILCAAAGKAGGFLARNWGNELTAELHQLSFDLHQELADELDIQSYRRLPTISADGNNCGRNFVSWLDRYVCSDLMDKHTAQVTPTEYCERVWEAALDGGAELLIDTVEGLVLEHDEKDGVLFIRGVKTCSSGDVECDSLAFCLGPWSGVAMADWLGLPLPMEGIKSTSIIYENVEEVAEEPFAVFCAEDGNGCHLELYPRPNGDLYVCGIGRSDYVGPERLRNGGDCCAADLIEPDPARVSAAAASMSNMCSIGTRPPDFSQACIRPCPVDGLPVMGRIPGVEGAFISCGHNCWGILWAPASALAISELIVDGHCECMDLSMFSPSRFIPTELDSSSEESSSNSGISSSRIMAMRNTRTISGSNSKSSSSGSSRSNDSRTSSSSDAEGSGADSTNDSRFSDNKDSRLSRSSGRGSRSGNSGSNSRREKLPFEREGFEPYEDCNYNQDDEDSTYDEYGDFCGVDSYDDIAS